MTLNLQLLTVLYCKRPAVLLSLAIFASLLTACANSPNAQKLEQSLAADSKLKDNSTIPGAQNVSDKGQNQQPEAKSQLPEDFPQDIPVYPNANLEKFIPASPEDSKVSTQWLSFDPSNAIASFYSQQFQAQNWNILEKPTDGQTGVFKARRNDLEVEVSIKPKSVTNAAPNQPQTATELLIEYQSEATKSAQKNTNAPQPGEPEFIGPTAQLEESTQPSPEAKKNNLVTTTGSQEFSDVKQAPPELQKYIQDLGKLGVLSGESTTPKDNSGSKKNQFQPNKPITKGEYARWLITAHNAMYGNNSTKQIRLASPGVEPAFQDVSSQSPDFPAIQGLAEAGVISSKLSGDSTAVLFRPDAPLAREQLILWKVPLDNRQGLPSANIDAVKQSWGFQDVSKIDPKALRAMLADHQNGEKSNIRRVFGYTTLFQPKKPVTRAEAAAALWYFGTESEGISAVEALKLNLTPKD